MNELIIIEVAYANSKSQRILKVEVSKGSSVGDAIKQSGILELFPEIDLSKQKVGVFSKARELSDEVHAGERIEIYRPLQIDPKEARRAKAKMQKK